MDQAIYFVIANRLCVLCPSHIAFYGVFFVGARYWRPTTMKSRHRINSRIIKLCAHEEVGQCRGNTLRQSPQRGPVGPVLAAQFGYLPGFIWLLVGAVVGGAVHDTVVLFASMKHQGKSLSEVAKAELGPVAGWSTGSDAVHHHHHHGGLSIVVVHALERNAWGTPSLSS